MKKKFETFNDGMLTVYSVKAKRTDFSAVKNTRDENSMNEIAELAYEEKSKRDSDMDFAESRGRTLSLKVKTRLRPNVNAKHKVVIGNMLYSIIHIDCNRQKAVMYLYLEEERLLDERAK